MGRSKEREPEEPNYYDSGFFKNGLPRVVSHHSYREEDDIMFVRDRDGVEQPVWSDRRIKVYTRFDTHSIWVEWRDELTGERRDVNSYEKSLAEAMDSAFAEQALYEREENEFVPIILSER